MAIVCLTVGRSQLIAHTLTGQYPFYMHKPDGASGVNYAANGYLPSISVSYTQVGCK